MGKRGNNKIQLCMFSSQTPMTKYVFSLVLFFRIDQSGMGPRLMLASKIGDPQLAFSLYFPLVAAVSWVSGVRYLGAVVACEWLNLVLKW